MPTTRVTVVAPEPLADEAAARRWLAGADGEADADDALRILNRVLHAHRLAAADPYVQEVGRERLLVVRVGWGDGDQLAEGRWTDAQVLPPFAAAKRHRSSALRPQERLAAVLTGRDVLLACEELVLRARHDLDAGRLREAALQLRVALEAALAELQPWGDRLGMAGRIGQLREERGAVGAAANAALEGGLDEAATADITRVIGRLEAALRVRTTAGFD